MCLRILLFKPERGIIGESWIFRGEKKEVSVGGEEGEKDEDLGGYGWFIMINWLGMGVSFEYWSGWMVGNFVIRACGVDRRSLVRGSPRHEPKYPLKNTGTLGFHITFTAWLSINIIVSNILSIPHC